MRAIRLVLVTVALLSAAFVFAAPAKTKPPQDPLPTCPPPARVTAAIQGSAAEGGNLFEDLLKKLADAAMGKATDYAFGWVTNAIFGGGGGGSSDELQKLQRQITEQQQQLANISSQVTALSQQLANFEQTFFNQTEQQEYDLLIAGMANDITALQTGSIALSLMQKKPIGSTLTGDEKKALYDMRTEMPRVIHHINEIVNPSSAGAKGALKVWTTIVYRHQPFYNPKLTTQGTIFVSDYTGPSFDQVDNYKGLMVQALNLMAEAHHIKFDYQGETYAVDNEKVNCYAGWVKYYFKQWDALPAKGIGRLPDSVVVDTQNKKMWSRAFVLPPTNPQTPNAVCWSKDCGGPGQMGYPVMTQPDLKQYVSTLTLAGYSGWRLPSNQDWKNLFKDAGNNSLVNWYNAQGFKGEIRSSDGASMPFWSLKTDGGDPNGLTLDQTTTGTMWGKMNFADQHECEMLTGDGYCPAIALVVRNMP